MCIGRYNSILYFTCVFLHFQKDAVKDNWDDEDDVDDVDDQDSEEAVDEIENGTLECVCFFFFLLLIFCKDF